MLYLLLGPDDFSKKEFVLDLAKKQGLKIEYFIDVENMPRLEQLIQSDLFSQSKILVLENLITSLDIDQGKIQSLTQSKNYICLCEDKIDKRTSLFKLLQKNKDIIKEFSLPHGKALDSWLIKRAEKLGGKISKVAADLLAKRLGRDNTEINREETKEIYSLWQADSEIKKLLAFAQKREVQETDVLELAVDNQEVDAFEITDALGSGNKTKAINLIEKFLQGQTGADEKGSIILLAALLAEQMRSACVARSLLTKKIPDAQILKTTGWKSGRLYVMKKVAGRFSLAKLKEALNKLESLDMELKSTNTPPKVLLDLIVSLM